MKKILEKTIVKRLILSELVLYQVYGLDMDYVSILFLFFPILLPTSDFFLILNLN